METSYLKNGKTTGKLATIFLVFFFLIRSDLAVLASVFSLVVCRCPLLLRFSPPSPGGTWIAELAKSGVHDSIND